MKSEKEWLLKEKYNGVATPEYEKDLVRLTDGEPLAYLIGSIPFLNTTIYLDSHPLIPRPETEYWVSEVLKEMPVKSKVLDLCAGSGCIGAAVQYARPEAEVHFAEIEERHHDTIRKNGGVHLYDGDLFQNITEKYDYVFTNPPYIDPKIDRTEVSVKEYEPSEALYGGTGGMEIIKKIISEALEYLNEEGTLVIEHEPEQTEEIAQLAEKYKFSCVSKKDQYDVYRWSVLKRT